MLAADGFPGVRYYFPEADFLPISKIHEVALGLGLSPARGMARQQIGWHGRGEIIQWLWCGY